MANTVVGGVVVRLLREQMAGIAQHVIEHETDPVTRGIVLNTSRVRTVDTLGRNPAGTKTLDFSALHPLQFGRAGAIQYAAIGTVLAQDAPPILPKSPSYPPVAQVAQREAEWLDIGLKWIQGNLTINRTQLLALQRGNPVEDFLAQWLRDPIEIIHQQLTTDFFGSADGLVGTINAAGGSVITNAGDTSQVEVSGKLRPFWRGQLLVAVDDSVTDKPTIKVSGSPSVDCVFMVVNVHSFAKTNLNKLKIIALDTPAAAWTQANNDALHLKGAYTKTGSGASAATSRACLGLGNFILDDATADGTAITLHGLTIKDTSDVYSYPELLSLVDTPTDARWPSPSIFEVNMDYISDRGMEAPDRWITTRGIRTGFYLTEGLYKTYNTELGSGVQRGADGGISGNMSVTSEMGVAEVIISAYCPKNTAFGIRPDAFVRYAPKGIEAVSFLTDNSLVGGGGMFLVARSDDAPIPVFESPFDYWIEMGCTKPQSLVKMDNIKEHADLIG